MNQSFPSWGMDISKTQHRNLVFFPSPKGINSNKLLLGDLFFSEILSNNLYSPAKGVNKTKQTILIAERVIINGDKKKKKQVKDHDCVHRDN